MLILPKYSDSDEKYCDIVKGEMKIINEEIELFNQAHYTTNLNVSDFLECVNHHLASIEQKIGKNSIEYINLSTKIVNVICNRVFAYINLSSEDNILDKLSTSETVKFYVNQREILVEALRICRKLENMNMDYAYRIKIFNKVKANVENKCHEKGIETRTTIQKNIDQLKAVGNVTGEVAKETAGCIVTLAIKIAIVIVIFLILMAIFGVK